MTLLGSLTSNNLVKFLNDNKKDISQTLKNKDFFLNELFKYYFEIKKPLLMINDNTTETGKSITMKQFLDRITKKLDYDDTNNTFS
jgi:hypothetical protein